MVQSKPIRRKGDAVAHRPHFNSKIAFLPTPFFIHEAITAKRLKLTTETTGTKSSKPGETCATIVTTLKSRQGKLPQDLREEQALQIANTHSFSDCGTLGAR
jgi:hypothetical protein